MKEITNQTHVIVFYDKSIKWINEKQKQNILERWGDKGFTNIDIDGSIYSVNQIAKILTAEEYWNEYPQKATLPEPPPFVTPDGVYKRFDAIQQTARSKKHLTALLEGYKKGVIEMVGSLENAKFENKLFIEKMQKKIDQITEEKFR